MDINIELKDEKVLVADKVTVAPLRPVDHLEDDQVLSFDAGKRADQSIEENKERQNMQQTTQRIDSETETLKKNDEPPIEKFTPEVNNETRRGMRAADMELSWHDILIKTKGGEKGCCSKEEIPQKVLLNKVSGRVRSGECLAIIGSSGAGKTTLLNYLSKKIQSDNLRITGDVLLNGEHVTPRHFSLISSYVMQDDILEATMTPLEILMFTAKLRFNLPLEQIEEKVHQMIDDLNLKRCQNTRIGGEKERGVSGGERKRTSIGVELISDPKVVFLDEPTTGLDSYNAYEVIALLNDLSKQGKIVIFTIHQPSSEIYDLLSKICILALGRTVYFGSREKCFDCFDSFGIPVPLNYNPFEHFMEKTNVSSVQQEDILSIYPKLGSIENLQERYDTYITTLNDIYEKDKYKYVDNLPPIQGFSDENKNLFEEKNVSLGFFYQFAMIYGRGTIITLRNPKVLNLKIIQTLVTGGLLSILFMNLVKDYSGIQDRLGVILNFIVFSILNASTHTVLLFADENKVFIRERANRLYSVFAYYLAKVFTEFPVFFISSCLFGVLVYLSAELNDTYSYKYYTTIAFLLYLSLGGSSYAFVLGNLATNSEVLIMMNLIFSIPMLLLSGFFANADNFAPYLIPFKYLSLFKYGFQIFTHIEFSGLSPLNCLNLDPELCTPLATRFTYLEPYYLSIILIGVLIVVFKALGFLFLYLFAKIKV